MSETPEATPNPETAASTPPPAGDQKPPAADATPPSPEAAGGDVLDNHTGDKAKEQPAGDVLSDDGVAKQEGVPDQYTFEAPEGHEIDQAALDAAMAAAKDAGLTQKQFDAMAKFDVERTQAANEQAVDAWNERVKGWREAARTDKEFGGPDYDANVTTAMSAVEKFGDADLKALLKSPSEQNPEGLAIGNHPAVLRFLNRIGKAMGDPSFVQGSEAAAAADGNEARLRRLYPSMFKEGA